jgi:O-antigen ligase
LVSGTVSALDKHLAFTTYFYIITTFFIFFYIGKEFFHYNRERNILSLIICICAGLVAFIGIMELYFGRNIIYEYFIANPFYERYAVFNARPMSTQLNPVVLGSYLLGCLPFTFFLIKNKSLYIRLIGIVSLLLSLTVIILTLSRGVILGLVALILFYSWKKRKKKLIFFLVLCLFLSVLFCSFGNSANLNRLGFKGLIFGNYDSIISEYRLSRVDMTIKILKEHLFSGIGFNHFRIKFNDYCNESEKGKEWDEFMIPDNMYLTFLAETGIIGTLGFLIFIFFLLKRGFKSFKESVDGNKKEILLICLSALIGLLVNMGAYELFYWNNPYILFCLLCGFIQGAIKNLSGQKYEN